MKLIYGIVFNFNMEITPIKNLVKVFSKKLYYNTCKIIQFLPILTKLYIFFSVDLLEMSIAVDSFDQHGLKDENDKLIDVIDIIICLNSMYEGIADLHPTLVNVPLCVDLSLNWVLNAYDV